MPKLLVTIDQMDGSTRVIGPLWPDEIDTRGMLFRLSESKIAGITFTRANPLTYLDKEKAGELANSPATTPARRSNPRQAQEEGSVEREV